MREQDIKQFIGVPVEAFLMESKMVLRGVFKEVAEGMVKLSSLDDVFVLSHGRRLSMKLMLAGSFTELEFLLKNVSYPCGAFVRCRAIKRSEMIS
ncbi:MAG: hypothetical protein ACT4NX_03020 [Deltaproteobacteria bacterium]